MGSVATSARVLLMVGLMVPVLASAQGTDDNPDPSESESLPVRMGVAGWGTMNLHRGDFTSYDGILECGTFEDAETISWMAGYLFEFPLSESFAISPRLHYWKADGDFTAPNPIPARIAVDDQTVVPLETEHTLETALDYLSLDILAKFSVAGPLYIAAGPSVGYPTRAAYEQEETIVMPQGVTFLNGDATRKIIAGNFDEQGTLATARQLRLAAVGAVGLDIDLAERLILSPEIGISWGLNDVLTSFPWKVHAIRAGALLSYELSAPSTDTIRLAAPDVPAPEPMLALEAFNRTNGVQLNYAEVAIAEERGSDLIPLLPNVFFAPNSAALASRYQRGGVDRSFTEEMADGETLDVYHRLLDIVGSRMLRFPESTITVTGCREPLDDSASTDELSRARASIVKDYLVSRWGIGSDRIDLKVRTLPEQPSNRTVADGREENRRAEISSNDPRILAPVNRRLGGITVKPQQVVVVPTAQFLEAESWEVTVRDARGGELFRTTGSGAIPSEIPWPIDPNRVDDLVRRGDDASSVTVEFAATTDEGERITARRDVPVRRTFTSRRLSGEIVRDSLVERTSLIFFDFDSPNISDFNRPVLDVVRARMRTNSAVEIVGLTDRIGDAEHNRALSQRRAAETSRQIQTRIVPEVIRSRGAGEEEVYDNDLPEGRMYNRTVVIETATPIEEGVR